MGINPGRFLVGRVDCCGNSFFGADFNGLSTTFREASLHRSPPCQSTGRGPPPSHATKRTRSMSSPATARYNLQTQTSPSPLCLILSYPRQSDNTLSTIYLYFWLPPTTRYCLSSTNSFVIYSKCCPPLLVKPTDPEDTIFLDPFPHPGNC